ncbi:MAG: hypothetical protein AMXMBFR68_11390 [Ignavibacteria bacterium]
MKNIIFNCMAIVIILTSSNLFGQCEMPTYTFNIQAPALAESNQSVTITAVPESDWPNAALQRFHVYLNGVEATVLSKTNHGLTVLLPGVTAGIPATLAVCVTDGPYAETTLQLIDHRDTLDQGVNKADPDPRTQDGPRQDLHKADRRPYSYTPKTHPNGGSVGTLPCEERHVIDGSFTTLKNNEREWSSIAPLIGRFSHMYLDYCPQTQTMYLMNYWLIGTGTYQQNCYNLFGFSTGNSQEAWLIKVTHDTARPVIVMLNGNDVTDDTTIVRGGAFGFGTSPSDTTPHTMYEFGVRASVGLFFLPINSDPVETAPSTTVGLECDKDGIDGYGLVREPHIRLAYFSNDGVTTRQSERYIPNSGVVGLETEPNTLTRELSGNTATYRLGSMEQHISTCTGVGTVDGAFTEGELDGILPANGKYSDLYAQYCNGKLHIVNDWVYCNEEADNATCYNLFELFTGNGAEHWGIWVWHDYTRRPTVYRNGIDVSNDTSIVTNGVTGWDSSIRESKPHAIYEFIINTMEGGFAMNYADPGLSSYCSLEPSSTQQTDKNINVKAAIYPNPAQPAGGVTVSNLEAGDIVIMYDLEGRRAMQQFEAASDTATFVIPQTMAAGRYSVRIIRKSSVIELPLMIER